MPLSYRTINQHFDECSCEDMGYFREIAYILISQGYLFKHFGQLQANIVKLNAFCKVLLKGT